MAPLSQDKMVKAFIEILSQTRELTLYLPPSTFLILSPSSIEKVLLHVATMIAIYCSLLVSVTALMTEVSLIPLSLSALDTQTCVLPTICHIQEVVSERVTASIIHTSRPFTSYDWLNPPSIHNR